MVDIQNHNTDEAPIKAVVQATAYFLSGLFLITTTIVHVSGTNVSLEIPTSEVTLAIGSWLTLFIGSILTLAGFLKLFSVIIKPLKVVLDSNKKYEIWLVAFLFATVTTEVVKRIIEIRNISFLFYLTIAFTLLLLIVIIVKSMSVFKNIGQLLTMC